MAGIPFTPLILGLLGLIPFFGTAIWAHVRAANGVELPIAALAFLAYGAVILSFLAGARWGMELSRATSDLTESLCDCVRSDKVALELKGLEHLFPTTRHR